MTGDAPCYLCLAEVVFVGKSSSLHNFAEHGNLLGRGLCYSAAFTSERSHAGVYYLVSGVDVNVFLHATYRTLLAICLNCNNSSSASIHIGFCELVGVRQTNCKSNKHELLTPLHPTASFYSKHVTAAT